MKKAFTLLELIFVVVIAGILAFVLIPKSSDTKLLESANQLISHIRYAQQLALNNDQFDPNDKNWYKKMWRIEFENNGTYKVWRGNEAQSNKIAPDPANPGQKLKDVQLKRGIIAKANKKVIFDELGRVYSDQATTKSYEHKIDQNTTIKLCKGSASSDCTGKEHIKLSIEPETGYILPEHCGAANKDGFSSCKVLDI
ncbi:putative type II secretion system protein [Candidatus Campylobacter infans]|uniref:Putative type II secretion system protein n=1 Tax=Candidatus Campylobacter infans TaxID=2561898 RepID=A0A7H9CKU2_9BACT|nr:type II secretion system protein [Candidatus Campylobacter infans]QLI05818.1 putative type II secretion system protein [Candidatus Campylobacter infans]